VHLATPAARFVPVQWIAPFEPAQFVRFDRIATEMRRQTEMMIRQVRALQPEPNALGKIGLASFGSLPAGTVRYSFSSTSMGNGTCSRSAQVISLGPGLQPKVVSKSAGDCDGAVWVPSSKSVRPKMPACLSIRHDRRGAAHPAPLAFFGVCSVFRSQKMEHGTTETCFCLPTAQERCPMHRAAKILETQKLVPRGES
jgi:hypothetical protein